MIWPTISSDVPASIMTSIRNYIHTALLNLKRGGDRLSSTVKEKANNRKTESANHAQTSPPTSVIPKPAVQREAPTAAAPTHHTSVPSEKPQVASRATATAKPSVASQELERGQNEIGKLIVLMPKYVADEKNYKEKSATLFSETLAKYGNAPDLWKSDLFDLLITMRRWELVEIALNQGAGTHFKNKGRATADLVTKRLQAEIDTLEEGLQNNIRDPLGLVKARSHTRKGKDALRVLKNNRAEWNTWVEKHFAQPAHTASLASTVSAPEAGAHKGTQPQKAIRLGREVKSRLTSRQEKTRTGNQEEGTSKTLAKATAAKQSSRSRAVPTQARDKSTAITSELRSAAGALVQKRTQFLNNHKAASALNLPLVVTKLPSLLQHSAPSVAEAELLTEADAARLFQLAHEKALQGSVSPGLHRALTTLFEDHGMKLVQALLREYHQQLEREGRIGAGDALTMLDDSEGSKRFDVQRRIALSAMHGAQLPVHDQTSKDQFREVFSSRANAFKYALVAEIRARENTRIELSKKMGEITVHLPEIFNAQRPVWIPRARRAKPPPIPRSNTDLSDGTSKSVAPQPAITQARVVLEQEVTRARKTLLSAFGQTARKNVYAPLDNIRDDLEFYFNVILPIAVRRTPLLVGQKLTEANWGKALETVWGVLDGAYQNQLFYHREGIAVPGDLQALVTAGSKTANDAQKQQIHVKADRNVEKLPYPLEDVAAEFVFKVIRSRLEQAPQAVEIRLDERRHQELLHALSKDTSAADATFVQETYQVMANEQGRLIGERNHMASAGEDPKIPRARTNLQNAARIFVRRVIQEQAVTPENLRKINRAIGLYCTAWQDHFNNITTQSFSEIFKNFHLPIDETPIEERFDMQS